MKKIYSLFLAVFAVMTMNAQQLLTIVKASEGIYNVTYNDAANNWAFYNPNSQPIGMYLFINPGDTVPSGTYNDVWSNITTVLNWDGTNYSGTINLNTHNFNQTGGVLPVGTVVNELRFLFTEAPAGNGAHQTADFQATAFGFTSSVITGNAAVSDVLKGKGSVVASGKLITAKKGMLNLSVYDYSGRIIKTMNVKADGNAIELNLNKKGNYILNIADGQSVENVKFAY